MYLKLWPWHESWNLWFGPQSLQTQLIHLCKDVLRHWCCQPGWSILQERVHCESPHCCSNLLFSPLIDCFMSQHFCLGACGSADLHICSSQWCHPFLFFYGQHIRHSYLIGSCWEDCGYGAPADWIFVGMGKQPFLRIRFSLMQSMGEHGSKENTQWVVWVELLPVKSLDSQGLELYFFPVQSEAELTRFCLDFSPGLTFILSLSLSVAADYDVHSLLSSWFWLASNQRQAPVSDHPCYYSPD